MPAFLMRGVALVAILALISLIDSQAAERPNIVWILSEDNSVHYYDLYGHAGAETPRIARLAEEGLFFEHAFSNAPVCSAARTTLMTSVYGPRLATHYHRRIGAVALPEGWNLFPAFLKEAGYYTTNNSKTDYNCKVDMKSVWDESSGKASWQKRPAEQTPFFHMQTFTTSHESSLHFKQQTLKNEKTAHDPAEVKLAPMYPDTETFRYTHARYLDRIQQIDKQVGQLVDELDAAGVLADTFIFYFGDHGGVLPRSKGFCYETGLHVPLVVRVPKKFSHSVDAQRGDRVSGFVEFVDFGPTTLRLAGVDVPEYVSGKPFLGEGVAMKDVNARDETFGYADRMDGKYEMVRSLRRGKLKYIRNFQGYYPDDLHNNYRYQMLAYAEWRKLGRAGELDGPAAAFTRGKPAELLFDIEQDPFEVNNLADDPAYQNELLELRKALAARLKALPDLSFYPETILVEEAVQQPIAFGEKHAGEIAALVNTANLAVLPFAEAKPKIETALSTSDPLIRYWALTACAQFGEQAKPFVDAARPSLKSDNLFVRIRAAEFIGQFDAAAAAEALASVIRESQTPVTTLMALNAVVFLRDYHGMELTLDIKEVAARGGEVNRRLDYLGW